MPLANGSPIPPFGMPGAGPARGNALMNGPTPAGGAGQAGSFGRVPPHLLDGLPPEFLALLQDIGQLVDLDGDGTPDIAVVPLNALNAASSAPPPREGIVPRPPATQDRGY